jgi:hypothetical protein
MPDGLEYKGDLWNKLESLRDLGVLFYKLSSEKQKNTMKTPLFQDIVDKLEKKSTNEIDENAILYSCHDVTMLNFL